MTNNEVMDQIHELLSKQHSEIIAKAEHLLHSGAIDVLSYKQGDYILAKDILHEVFIQEAEAFRPLSDEGKGLTKNLRFF